MERAREGRKEWLVSKPPPFLRPRRAIRVSGEREGVSMKGGLCVGAVGGGGAYSNCGCWRASFIRSEGVAVAIATRCKGRARPDLGWDGKGTWATPLRFLSSAARRQLAKNVGFEGPTRCVRLFCLRAHEHGSACRPWKRPSLGREGHLGLCTWPLGTHLSRALGLGLGRGDEPLHP